MKNALRIVLLVLLAVLLPIRGAMAAAMLCPPALDAASAHAHGDARSVHGAEAAHDHAQHSHHHEHAASSAQANGDDGACNLCAAFCAATPLPSSAPTLTAPSDDMNASFPELHAAVPSFISSGPERPPRSI